MARIIPANILFMICFVCFDNIPAETKSDATIPQTTLKPTTTLRVTSNSQDAATPPNKERDGVGITSTKTLLTTKVVDKAEETSDIKSVEVKTPIPLTTDASSQAIKTLSASNNAPRTAVFPAAIYEYATSAKPLTTLNDSPTQHEISSAMRNLTTTRKKTSVPFTVTTSIIAEARTTAIVATTIPDARVTARNNAITTVAPAIKRNATTKMSAPASQHKVATSAMTAPASQHKVATSTTAPASQHSVATTTTAPASQHTVATTTTAPASQHTVATTTTAPDNTSKVATTTTAPDNTSKVATTTTAPGDTSKVTTTTTAAATASTIEATTVAPLPIHNETMTTAASDTTSNPVTTNAVLASTHSTKSTSTAHVTISTAVTTSAESTTVAVQVSTGNSHTKGVTWNTIRKTNTARSAPSSTRKSHKTLTWATFKKLTTASQVPFNSTMTPSTTKSKLHPYRIHIWLIVIIIIVIIVLLIVINIVLCIRKKKGMFYALKEKFASGYGRMKDEFVPPSFPANTEQITYSSLRS